MAGQGRRAAERGALAKTIKDQDDKENPFFPGQTKQSKRPKNKQKRVLYVNLCVRVVFLGNLSLNISSQESTKVANSKMGVWGWMAC